MTKIGIMGGTFDPIHKGHLAMAQAAMEQGKMQQVWFMPSKNPPHKNQQKITKESSRSKMVQLGIAKNTKFCYSDFELKREGITYTADTLRYLCQLYPSVEWCFIMGADSFFQLEQWHQPETVMKLATVYAVTRDGITGQKMQQHKEYLEMRYGGKIELFTMPPVAVSSSQIRNAIKHGEDIREMLPEKVWEYIVAKQLYR